jgi:nitroreductase
MEVFEAIKNRRSIRQFKPTPVSDEDLNTILEAARFAPSWHNSQPWRFIVVKNQETKNRLSETIPDINRASKAVIQAPVVIALCAEPGKSGYIRGELVSDKGETWYMFDVALAAQNLALEAHALGLGTLNVGYFDSVQASKVLELPEGIVMVELIPLGYPDIDAVRTPRKEFSEIVFYEKYGLPENRQTC